MCVYFSCNHFHFCNQNKWKSESLLTVLNIEEIMFALITLLYESFLFISSRTRQVLLVNVQWERWIICLLRRYYQMLQTNQVPPRYLIYYIIKKLVCNPLNANAQHYVNVACSGCSVSYRQNHWKWPLTVL